MRQIIYFIVLVLGMILALLYFEHITRLPGDSPPPTPADTVSKAPAIGGTIRQRVERDVKVRESQVGEVLDEMEK